MMILDQRIYSPAPELLGRNRRSYLHPMVPLGIGLAFLYLFPETPRSSVQSKMTISVLSPVQLTYSPALTPSGVNSKSSSNDDQVYDRFGFTVSLQGDIALIGAIFGDGIEADTGAVYVFTHTGVSWIQKQKIFASDGASWDIFGQSVSLDGDTAIVGARFDEGYAGSAYVFTFSGANWTQQQKLTASDTGVYDSFGVEVSLDGNVALIGAEDEISHDSSGAAYVFTRTGTIWTEQAKLLPSDGVPWDWFGGRVSLFDDTALIGAAYDDDDGIDSGSAYLFQYSNQTQNQPPIIPSNPDPSNGMTEVDVNVQLSWVGGDPNPGDTVTYDVYFGTSSSPPKVTNNQSITGYHPGMMQYSTTYY